MNARSTISSDALVRKGSILFGEERAWQLFACCHLRGCTGLEVVKAPALNRVCGVCVCRRELFLSPALFDCFSSR